jgi:hypothetical protein
MPAISPSRAAIEFLVDEDLAEFGDTSLVARTWHWVLHGDGPGRLARPAGCDTYTCPNKQSLLAIDHASVIKRTCFIRLLAGE